MENHYRDLCNGRYGDFSILSIPSFDRVDKDLVMVLRFVYGFYSSPNMIWKQGLCWFGGCLRVPLSVGSTVLKRLLIIGTLSKILLDMGTL